ncbi:flavoprotein [Auritidibacter ignavus]|uniref:flavoprotein n=1 Tax=Auritidibacter ignavus TaxID=678932 RepID=UPI00109D5088
MKITLVVTGAVAAAHFPLHLSWIRRNASEDLERIVLTRSAQRFLTRTSVTAIGDLPVLADEWEDFETVGLNHVAVGEVSDAILVYPASANYVMRLSLLAMDSPSVAAIATGTSSVVICPALPPRIGFHPLYQQAESSLRSLPRYSIVQPIPGESLASSEPGHVPPPIWDVWPLLSGDNPGAKQ